MTTTDLFSISMNILHFYTVCTLFCLTSFPQPNYFEIHSCCSIYGMLFLFIVELCSIIWINLSLFIHLPLMDSWVVPTFSLLWIMLLSFCMDICFRFFHPGVKWPNHMVGVEIAKPFSKVVVPLYIPTCTEWKFLSPHILVNIWYDQSFSILSILIDT